MQGRCTRIANYIFNYGGPALADKNEFALPLFIAEKVFAFQLVKATFHIRCALLPARSQFCGYSAEIRNRAAL
jgi:hypothetical protein